ncbi:hypothetical protein GCM10023340_02970 [Nocardioides marinquilinus]|uniref:Uncharacterized protein n=1 Tax=Nocardioides marinquilinus TaxID=1210400 RepID=A0ABP9P7T9_9ACTN
MNDPTDQAGRRTGSLLRGVTDDLQPDIDLLVASGTARGRVLRRRRRVGTALAAVAVVGVIGTAAGVAPGLLGAGGAPSGFSAPTATDSAEPDPEPTEPTEPTEPAIPSQRELERVDADLAVPAARIPQVVGEQLGGEPGPILRDPPFGVSDEPQDKTVHFLWQGTLTTVVIERADSLASCQAMVDPANQPDGQPGGECVVEGGVLLLRWGPDTADGVTAQGILAWRHGYIVSVLSYNAADGKDVPPVTDVPPISPEQLTALATSDAWFAES